MPERSYKAKILLFGEYTIIFGGSALAIPIPQFQGTWAFEDGQKIPEDLKDFGHFLEQLKQKGKLLSKLDTTLFLEEIEKGLYFDSTIPQGYGAGSSGALCAAVYDRYLENPEEKTPIQLKKELAQIEAYFHGSSSGVDPLVSYLDQAISIHSDDSQVIDLPEYKEGENSIFLLNTGIARKTGPFVNIFLDKCKDEAYKAKCMETLGKLNKQAIEAFTNQNQENLIASFEAISRFQLEYFKEMILEPFQKLWQEGLSRDLYPLKLCGAGGGGFIIGLTRNFEALKELITEYELIELFRI